MKDANSYDGGCVFPGTEVNGLNMGVPGMSMRQYYAGLAMQGILAYGKYANPIDMAGFAFVLADAMIAQENK